LGAYAQEEMSGSKEVQVTSARRWSIQILKSINENAYKVDLPGKHGVNVTFNISDLTLFDVGNEPFRS
jgi:hypothetical protein